MSFGVRQTRRNKSWTEILVEESERSLRKRGAKRGRTFRRMYFSVFILFGAVFCLYCSFFYIGAFLDMGKIVGVSQAQRADVAKRNILKVEPTTKRTLFSPLIDALSVNRIYLREGQSIIATYSLPNTTNMTLSVKQCDSVPIIEIFKCKYVGIQETVIKNKTAGFIKFTVTEPGFYYFENAAIKAPANQLKRNHNYKIVWQRA